MAKIKAPTVISAASGTPTELVNEGTDRRNLLVHYANHDDTDYVTIKLMVSDNDTWDEDKAPYSDSVPPDGSGAFLVHFLDAADNLVALAGKASSIVAYVADSS